MKGWKAVNNFFLFQVGWFACVLSAAGGFPLAGTTVAVMVVLIHLSLIDNAPRELVLLLTAGVAGAVWESLVTNVGWFDYSAGMVHELMAPHWIMIMWPMFATTINGSLAWLKRNVWIAMACGALFAPTAYYAGYRLGAVSLPDVGVALIAQSVGWAVLLPLLTSLAVAMENPATGMNGNSLLWGKRDD